MKNKIFKKNGNNLIGPGIDLWPVGNCGLTPAPVRLFQFFEIFLFKKNEFLEVWKMGQGF
jgi:hypothetical protein